MKNILSIILAFGSHLPSFAQPGALDLSFDPGAGPNGKILASAIQSDGKIIIGGEFGVYNGIFTTCLARLNNNGSLDTTFHVGIPPDPFPFVYAIAIQPDGKIIIGGGFTSYDSVATSGIARLNSDGSLDTSFHIGTGFNERVYALEIQPDGKILAGGLFTNYNGTTCKRLARLNVDGSYDMSFNTAIHGANGSIEAIALQPDGKIIIGGDFTVYDTIRLAYDTLCWRVARVNPDGSRDSSFVPALGAHSVVHTLAVQPDSLIIIGGNFSTYNFESIGRIARIYKDAWVDSWFKVNSGSGFNNHVFDVELMSNGKILVAGNYTTHNGTTINRISRLHSYGVLDTTFNPGTGADWVVYAIKLQSDGKIIIAGDFATYNGTTRKRIARLYNCLTPQPGILLGEDSTLCPGEVLIYSVAPDSTAESYQWTFPTGWIIRSDSTSDSITVISNGQGGLISVRAFSDSCGYSDPQTKTIYRNQPPEQPICLVTVDDSSDHNILVWEKTVTDLIDSFFIYRLTTNVYTRIASVHYDSLSEYHDYDADPNSTAFSYKISALDTCRVETALSPFHRTIHLQNFGNGIFQWTQYDINFSFPVISYHIYRDDFGNSNFIPIDTLSAISTTFNDINHASFPNSQYVVDANLGFSCTPQRGTINTTRSNIRKINVIDTPVVMGMETTALESIKIYPNPSEGEIMLSLPASIKITDIRLFNSLGKIVWCKIDLSGNLNTIQTGILPKGIYVIAIETSIGYVKKKVIIQ